ncbi:MAG: alpha-glucoside transport system permease protein [Frankiales bacterium]|nr:alpha-glucoside transport system permease protein [Frankiales bacterium]
MSWPSKIGEALLALVVAFGVIAALFYLGSIAPRRLRNRLVGVIFIGPALLFITIGLVIPAVRTFILSFKGADDPSHTWVGWANYSWVIHDPDIHIVLRNTVLWIAIAPLVATGAGLGLAVLIDKMKRESIPKSLIFAPMAVSFVGASIIWGVVYQHDQTGLLTALAHDVGWNNPPFWLLWKPWNNLLLMVILIWIETGFAMVLLSAAIKGIPKDVIEAAELDGASGWQQFTDVTVPMIRPTLVVVLTTIMIATLKLFDIIAATTGGNYNTSVLSFEMYNQTFVIRNYGRGAALAIILFIAVTPVLLYNVRVLRRERTIR